MGASIAGLVICVLLYADDVVLLAESPEQLQKLLDITWEYARKWHFSFGISKCQVVLGPSCPKLEREFKLGDHILQVVPAYKYLGTDVTLTGSDYSIFLKKKWKKVFQRLAKTRKVGGHMDGLCPTEARKLYMSQILPIIEFGSVVLPYIPKVLEELERMQAMCIQQLFGFYRSTKRETMLVLSGLCSMKSRIAQIKLCFFNKLKTFGSDLYINKIMSSSMDRACSIGLRRDVELIYKAWSNYPSFVRVMGPYSTFDNCEIDQKLFNQLCRGVMEEVDMSACLSNIEKSALYGSGQALHVHRYCNKILPSVCPLLMFEPRTRRVRTLFLNALSGCDFLTPFNYKKKPKCILCEKCPASWKHLLFECEGRVNGLTLTKKWTSKLFGLKYEFKPAQVDSHNARCVRRAASNSLELLQSLKETNNIEGLLNFAFGVCYHENSVPKPLRFPSLNGQLCEVTGAEIYSVQKEWLDKMAASYSTELL